MNPDSELIRSQSQSAEVVSEGRPGLWRRVWRSLGAAVTVAAVMVATVAVVVAIASHLSPKGQYTVFGHPVMSMLSGSMSPVIKTGDLIYDDRISISQAQHLHVGEIISFRASPDKIFTHRIHALEKVNGAIEYQTKGDANNAPDQPLVAPSQIVGLYNGKVPYGGYVLNALHKPISLALLLAAPFLWFLSAWFASLAADAEGGKKPLAVPPRGEAPVM